MLILFVILGITITLNVSDVSAAAGNQTTASNQVNQSLQQAPSSANSNANTNNSGTNTQASGTNQNVATPITPKVTFTTIQINTASSSVKTFVESNHRLPNYVTISNYKVTMPQFLQLLTDDLLQVSNGSTSPIVLKVVNNPVSPSENVKSGNLAESEYLNLAQQMKSYIDSSGKAPDYITTSLGKIRYENLIYTYSKVMNYYNTNKRLPNTVSVSAFTTSSSTSTEGSASNTTATTNNTTTKYIDMSSTPPKNGYSAYNIIITPQTVTATAKCSCGKGTYTYQTKSFVNYCPQCHRYGTLTYSKPGAEGQWTCSYCDCDYCMQCGKEKIVGTTLWLTPA